MDAIITTDGPTDRAPLTSTAIEGLARLLIELAELDIKDGARVRLVEADDCAHHTKGGRR